MNLGRKQSIADQQPWIDAMARARELVPDSALDDLVDQVITQVRREARSGKQLAYGWSGGKDSQALRYVMQQAGVRPSMHGRTAGLEWPAMLRWTADHMPAECDVVEVPLDVAWLRANPRMLFPTGRHSQRWIELVQKRSQEIYFRRTRPEIFILGRRRKDGNWVGPLGEDRYTGRSGVIRWSPLADWPHEAVFALLDRENIPLPPCYQWPRGFQVGTGSWPSRSSIGSPDAVFAECWEIDADVIRQAAAELPKAADWMFRHDKT